MIDKKRIFEEAFNLLCGDRIGRGMSRDVFLSPLLPDCVIKVESNPSHRQNVMEWEAWQRVSNTPFAKWFAPCEHISLCGTVLVMQRTTPASLQQYPKKMPAFLTDFKRKNYGIYKGQFVCHDYGTSLLMEEGMTRRLKKADWWGV